MKITGNQFYKVSEDFETTYAICNEKGLLEIANNDREREDGTIAEEFKTVEDAIKFLTEEKLLNVQEIDATEIDIDENSIVINGI